MRTNRLGAVQVAVAACALLGACAVMRNPSTPGEYADDAALASYVRSRLAQDPAVPATSVEIEALRGIVSLSGYAPSQLAKERAGELARDVPGVREVRNDIVVYP
jgi:hyperosmotically inducible periplasmic protein